MLGRKDFIRYSRQIMFPAMGEQGQEKLLQARVAVVGLGGLGNPVVQYLAGAGIGQFVLVDDDHIATENLHRQLLFRDKDVGESKVLVAGRCIEDINPKAQCRLIDQRLDTDALTHLFEGVDILLDCTDSIESRLQINKAAVQAKKPHVLGTAIRAEGQIVSFDHAIPASPCFACVMSEQDGSGLTCAESGVLGPVLGVIGSAMAMSAIKYLVMPESFLINQWQFYDALKQQWMSLKIEPNQSCIHCR